MPPRRRIRRQGRDAPADNRSRAKRFESATRACRLCIVQQRNYDNPADCETKKANSVLLTGYLLHFQRDAIGDLAIKRILTFFTHRAKTESTKAPKSLGGYERYVLAPLPIVCAPRASSFHLQYPPHRRTVCVFAGRGALIGLPASACDRNARRSWSSRVGFPIASSRRGPPHCI